MGIRSSAILGDKILKRSAYFTKSFHELSFWSKTKMMCLKINKFPKDLESYNSFLLSARIHSLFSFFDYMFVYRAASNFRLRLDLVTNLFLEK